MSFSSIINKYRTQSFNTADQGTKFELLMKGFIQTYSVFNGQGIKNVWLWNDFPSKKDFGTGHDVGIDLVVHTENNDYWAVQCKCYGKSTQIDKPLVDTFITSSAKVFHDVDDYEKMVNFARRYWMDTSGKGFTKNAEESLKNQPIPVTRLSYYDLENADVDWDKLDAGLFGNNARGKRYGIRPHQQKAIDFTHKYFKSHDRGKLIMACGTGKTFTSLKIAEKEIGEHAGVILFLAPSIALVGQTLKEWSDQAEKPIHGICVCSDPKITKKIDDSDEISTSIIDLALPASTDLNNLITQINYARILQESDGGAIVVFSTYQSISVVSNLQKQTGDKLIFDLCICDEAHRTTGVTLKGDEDSEFVKVHDSLFINAKKRLYMTATPRLYNDAMKQKADKADAILCSMDDESIYGQEIYRIGFGEAVKLGLLSDYKVMILTLNEDEMSNSLQNAISTEDSEIPTDDSLKLIGCINALSKITKDEKLLKEIDPKLMHNAIAFCQNIKISKKMVSYLEKCRDAYYSTLSEEQRKNIVSINADHVDGSMGAIERSEKLNWLKNVNRDSNDCNVLMNVRCLSEGVDVPSLDAVLFLSARNSQVDVVQSVGRVMRKAPGKQYGYIIIPVVIPSNIKPEDALNDNKRFAVVWTVLQALRAHDDRFNACINRLELNHSKPNTILIGGSVGSDDDSGSGTNNQDLSDLTDKISKQLEFQFDEFQGAIYAKIVEKCGDRRYWEQWAVDIAKIAERHIVQIKKLISVENSPAFKAFNKYIGGLRKNINPYVTDEGAIEMLAQHFITQPVFEALFENYSFADNNPISKSMASMVQILHEQSPKEENDKLNRFYDSVRERCQGIDNAEAKQKLIIELYDKFFKTAFPKTVKKLGIVYTPVEVVDFIINSIEIILNNEFNKSLSDEGIHILDPFTGTGTFIVRLIQSGLINPKDLIRKYHSELHACEIVLLAYYIASINIENAYHDMVEKLDFNDDKKKYTAFDGIVLTDTFQITEDKTTLFDDIFPQNSKRVNDLKSTPITIILGNPPYSVGSDEGNEVDQNQSYPLLENRISETFMKNSSSKGLRSLHDSYIKAFRWSLDRLEDNDGIVGFITNSGWLTKKAADGIRATFSDECDKIYCVDLKGAIRGKTTEDAHREGQNIFDILTGVAIVFLIKKKNKTSSKAKIKYYEIDDYLSRKDKLDFLKEQKSFDKLKSQNITPNENNDWINKRSSKFASYIPLASKNSKDNTYFDLYSGGLLTSRDSWCYNFDKNVVIQNMSHLVDDYNQELKNYLDTNQDIEPKKFVNLDPTETSWTRALYSNFKSQKFKDFNKSNIVEGIYRPFQKEYVYFDSSFNECSYKMPSLFPKGQENVAIVVAGSGARRNIRPLIVNMVTDLNLFDAGAQLLPLYYYKEVQFTQNDLFGEIDNQYTRYDGISDFIYTRAKEKYGPKVKKDDIFYYVYGILHQLTYIKKFESDIKLMMPRIPLVNEPKTFWNVSNIGRELADLHLNFENVPCPKEIQVIGDKGNYDVRKITFKDSKIRDIILYNDDISIINVPSVAYEYVINGKSAIEWVLDRYKMYTHPVTKIQNNPNDWGNSHNKPRYILDLLLSIIGLSVKSMELIHSLPDIDWDNE